MKKILFIAATVLLFGINSAHALVPTIDGNITSGSEWSDFIIYGTDINEDGIPDSWDIKSVYMKIITGGGGLDGLYFRVDTWDTPTLSGATGSSGEAYLQLYLDYDGNSLAERLVDLNGADEDSVGIYSIPPIPPIPANMIGDWEDGTDFDLGSIIEIYVPDTLLSTGISFNDFGLYAYLDNASDRYTNDRAPDGTDFYHPVPEPLSILLFSFGALGFGILRKIKIYHE